jgi:hypothetical protein
MRVELILRHRAILRQVANIRRRREHQRVKPLQATVATIILAIVAGDERQPGQARYRARVARHQAHLATLPTQVEGGVTAYQPGATDNQYFHCLLSVVCRLSTGQADNHSKQSCRQRFE